MRPNGMSDDEWASRLHQLDGNDEDVVGIAAASAKRLFLDMPLADGHDFHPSAGMSCILDAIFHRRPGIYMETSASTIDNDNATRDAIRLNAPTLLVVRHHLAESHLTSIESELTFERDNRSPLKYTLQAGCIVIGPLASAGGTLHSATFFLCNNKSRYMYDSNATGPIHWDWQSQDELPSGYASYISEMTEWTTDTVIYVRQGF
jgi:hypothetical protein